MEFKIVEVYMEKSRIFEVKEIINPERHICYSPIEDGEEVIPSKIYVYIPGITKKELTSFVFTYYNLTLHNTEDKKVNLVIDLLLKLTEDKKDVMGRILELREAFESYHKGYVEREEFVKSLNLIGSEF